MMSEITHSAPNATNAVELLDVRAVAAMLQCSPRHVYRLSDAGKMPPPVRLGGIVRWSRQRLEEWLRQGCPTLRHIAKGGAR